MVLMNTPRWAPSVTVAAIIEDKGRYLLVEEQTPEGLRLNNPAGHLEPGESPLQGVVREALEETGRDFVPAALVGIYLARLLRPARAGVAAEDITYLRFAYCGTIGPARPGRPLDTGIVRTLWLSLAELRATAHRHRSPLVLRCAEDHAAGIRQALDTVTVHGSVFDPAPLR
jgi:8-oxo-dGTP pyrophosphatase MutT (NUDIX family)